MYIGHESEARFAQIAEGVHGPRAVDRANTVFNLKGRGCTLSAIVKHFSKFQGIVSRLLKFRERASDERLCGRTTRVPRRAARAARALNPRPQSPSRRSHTASSVSRFACSHLSRIDHIHSALRTLNTEPPLHAHAAPVFCEK